jgi:dynein heavy chain
LEKKLEEHSKDSHPEFRVFISAEPAPSPEDHIIPQGILENSIKVTNEPPTGMHANLHKALDNFTQVLPGREGRREPILQRANWNWEGRREWT